jgi:hypothetical protein
VAQQDDLSALAQQRPSRFRGVRGTCEEKHRQREYQSPHPISLKSHALVGMA